ncbi:hypothetical protein DFS33DRAFT_709155 [Desarmillaria ectypa]|nr:hypothetical protein DFS33DRAFT_709155 [Desarmillaria ectypa]
MASRRLLYVACTRAKGLLYLLNVVKRKIAGNFMERSLSYFVEHAIEEDETVLTLNNLSTFPEHERATLCQVLERREPPEEEVRMRVEGFYESARNRQPFGHDFDTEAALITAMHQHPFEPAHHEIEAKFIPVSQIEIKPDIKPVVQPLKPPFGVTVAPDVKPRIKPDPDTMSAAFPHRQKPLWNSNADIKPYTVSHSDVKTPRSWSDGSHTLALPAASSSRDLESVQARISKRSPRPYLLSHETELDSDVLDPSLSSPPRPPKAKQLIKPEPLIMDLTEPAPKRVNERTTIKRKVAAMPVVKVEGAATKTSVKRELSVIILDPPTPQTSVKHKKPSKVIVEPRRLPAPPLPMASSPSAPQTSSLKPGVKRRLGMGRIVGGYANKKFKLPT